MTPFARVSAAGVVTYPRQDEAGVRTSR
jgi:hypothetical protein